MLPYLCADLKIPVMEVHMYFVYLISFHLLVFFSVGEGHSVLNDLYMALNSSCYWAVLKSHPNNFTALLLRAS